MVGISLAGPAISARAIELQPGLFRVSRQTLTLIVITLLLITALYTKFW
jgi:SSS family solute:Na+ symporter